MGFGLYQGRRLLLFGRINSDSIPETRSMLKKCGRRMDGTPVIICSVVPKSLIIVKKVIKEYNRRNKVFIVGKDIRPRLVSRYDREEIGADRLVNAYGAALMRRLPCLIIDFGTAITFDLVSKKAVFEGGLIVPGLKASLEGLLSHAAQLSEPKRLGLYKGLVGKRTGDAIDSGLLNGFGSLADGLIRRYRRQYGPKLQVVATGGDAALIGRYSEEIDRIDPLHTIKSLELIYHREKA